MGNCDFGFGHFDQGIKRLTKAAELCEAAGNVEDAGYAYAWLGWNHLYRGHYDRVLAVKEELLRMMEQRFNPRWYVRGLCGASRACICLGRWDQAVEEAEKALKVAEESSDNSYVVFSAYNLTMAYTCKGDMSRAVEYGELALQKAPTPGDQAISPERSWMGFMPSRRAGQRN
jgi:tetratricopeptide (TPR) repeat protein